MFRNVSPDSVWSRKFGCPVLSNQETHMPIPVEPYLSELFLHTYKFWTKYNGISD